MIKSNESKAIERNHMKTLELNELMIKMEKSFHQKKRETNEQINILIKQQKVLGVTTGFAHQYIRKPSYS